MMRVLSILGAGLVALSLNITPLFARDISASEMTGLKDRIGRIEFRLLLEVT